MEYLIYIIVTIIFILAFLFGYLIGPKICKNSIDRKMDKIGATLVFYEQCYGFIKIGPFAYVGRHSNVYFVQYKLNGVEYEYWVKFTALLFTEWRM